MIGDIELHHAAAQALEARRSACARPCPARPAWCRRRACRCGLRSRRGRGGRNRTTSAMSVAQSLGILVPTSIAARMIEVPSGTLTDTPSMVSVTVFSGFRGGRAVIDLLDEAMAVVLTRPRIAWRGRNLGEMVERAQDGIGRKAAQRAERAEFHASGKDPRAARYWPRPFAPPMMRSITSTPRVEPIRQGVHLPQTSMAQNSIAKRAICAMSTVSSNTTSPPWPIRPSRAAKAS